MPNGNLFARAQGMLRRAVDNPNATFHPGQWEAIEALVDRRQKRLVVERTGWGKSMVYFISTKLLRDAGRGPTLVISPLLALMRNQVAAAKRLGLQSATINSTNTKEWDDVRRDFLGSRIDLLLISPERLANEKFMAEVLRPIAGRIGLMVIDAVHCISDWGHDFRPDYRRISNILRQMPRNMPVIGTTATANDRVVADIEGTLGNIRTQRGPLRRKSLALQSLVMPDQAHRLAWLSKYIPNMTGTGIVYTLTTRDARNVAQWLQRRGIDAQAYYSYVTHEDFEDSNAYREYLEELLLKNKIKVLVATTALGMGYDKPDLSFVIHYQAPGSAVSYYQQVGRAGRAIDRAYGIIMSGQEDAEIFAYFRSSAFPSENTVKAVLTLLERHGGLSQTEIMAHLNIRQGQIVKVLKFLSVETPAPIIKEGYKWRRAPVRYQMDNQRIERLTQQREAEWQEVQNYISTQGCRMAFLQHALNDSDTSACGGCDNCEGEPLISREVPRADITEAMRFLRHSEFPFKAKIQIPKGALTRYGLSGNLRPQWRAEEGRILSKWGDAGWGSKVQDGKNRNAFDDELVGATADMVRRWNPNPSPRWITAIPSLRNPSLVHSFAKRLAKQLRLRFYPVIEKAIDNDPQKFQQNKFHQCKNLDGVFRLRGHLPPGPVLLVDDATDSGWTLTIASALLLKAGSGKVFPLALTSTAPGA